MNNDAEKIVRHVLKDADPSREISRILTTLDIPQRDIMLIAVGKAAWDMAKAATDSLAGRISRGLVITKYGHSRGPIGCLEIREAAHPVPDNNSFAAADAALKAVNGLTEDTAVLFLLSGGTGALFEKPLIPCAELADIGKQLLNSGASINEINCVRKRFSGVKGGRFAAACAPAKVYSILLSDVLGDKPDVIGGGPTCPDTSTCAGAREIVRRYGIRLSGTAAELLDKETVKTLDNAETHIIGGVKQLCASGAEICAMLGYQPIVLTSTLNCEAREAGAFLAAIAREHQDTDKPLAFLAGGETVVHVRGGGLGGRNQELALAAAAGISGCRNTCVFSFGSDGTDGPTDAAGGCVDENTLSGLAALGISVSDTLAENDSYHALQAIGGLIVTGPTGTNINDLSAVLIRR